MEKEYNGLFQVNPNETHIRHKRDHVQRMAVRKTTIKDLLRRTLSTSMPFAMKLVFIFVLKRFDQVMPLSMTNRKFAES